MPAAKKATKASAKKASAKKASSKKVKKESTCGSKSRIQKKIVYRRCQKRTLPPALALYKKAKDDVMGKPQKGEFQLFPKKNSAMGKKIAARYAELKAKAAKKK